MSYYSEVGLACTKKVLDYLRQLDCFVPDEVFVTDDRTYICHWDWTTWYDYEEGSEAYMVSQYLMELNRLPLEDTEEYGYKFIRIGESLGDIETLFNDPDLDLEYSSRIEIPKGLRKVFPNGQEIEPPIELCVQQEERPEFIGNLIELFEDFLEKRGVEIPSSIREMEENNVDRTENSAVIYGMDYGELEEDLLGYFLSWSE